MRGRIPTSVSLAIYPRGHYFNNYYCFEKSIFNPDHHFILLFLCSAYLAEYLTFTCWALRIPSSMPLVITEKDDFLTYVVPSRVNNHIIYDFHPANVTILLSIGHSYYFRYYLFSKLWYSLLMLLFQQTVPQNLYLFLIKYISTEQAFVHVSLLDHLRRIAWLNTPAASLKCEKASLHYHHYH